MIAQARVGPRSDDLDLVASMGAASLADIEKPETALRVQVASPNGSSPKAGPSEPKRLPATYVLAAKLPDPKMAAKAQQAKKKKVAPWDLLPDIPAPAATMPAAAPAVPGVVVPAAPATMAPAASGATERQQSAFVRCLQAVLESKAHGGPAIFQISDGSGVMLEYARECIASAFATELGIEGLFPAFSGPYRLMGNRRVTTAAKRQLPDGGDGDGSSSGGSDDDANNESDDSPMSVDTPGDGGDEPPPPRKQKHKRELRRDRTPRRQSYKDVAMRAGQGSDGAGPSKPARQPRSSRRDGSDDESDGFRPAKSKGRRGSSRSRQGGKRSKREGGERRGGQQGGKHGGGDGRKHAYGNDKDIRDVPLAVRQARMKAHVCLWCGQKGHVVGECTNALDTKLAGQ